MLWIGASKLKPPLPQMPLVVSRCRTFLARIHPSAIAVCGNFHLQRKTSCSLLMITAWDKNKYPQETSSSQQNARGLTYFAAEFVEYSSCRWEKPIKEREEERERLRDDNKGNARTLRKFFTDAQEKEATPQVGIGVAVEIMISTKPPTLIFL